MNLKRCANGHYYDASVYSECPRCNKAEGAAKENKKAVSVTVNQTEEKKKIAAWLVGIKGKYYGRIFELEMKKYVIGAAGSMDIYLKEDESSNDSQLLLSYDAENRCFMAEIGNARELVYVNEDVLLEVKRLHSRDRIQMGENIFMYIPLCDEDFVWK